MCSSVFTECDPGHLIHTLANRAQENRLNDKHSPMRGAVAHAGWALRRPVGPTAASLVPSPPMRRKSVRGDVRYVYSVIEAHAVRYKQGATGREFGRTDRRPGRTHPASPASIRSTNTPGHPATKKRNVYLCVHDGHIPSNRSASR